MREQNFSVFVVFADHHVHVPGALLFNHKQLCTLVLVFALKSPLNH